MRTRYHRRTLNHRQKCLEWFYPPLFCPSFSWNPIWIYLTTIYIHHRNINEFTDKRFKTDEGPRAFRLVIHILLSPTRLYLYSAPSFCSYGYDNWDLHLRIQQDHKWVPLCTWQHFLEGQLRMLGQGRPGVVNELSDNLYTHEYVCFWRLIFELSV